MIVPPDYVERVAAASLYGVGEMAGSWVSPPVRRVSTYLPTHPEIGSFALYAEAWRKWALPAFCLVPPAPFGPFGNRAMTFHSPVFLCPFDRLAERQPRPEQEACFINDPPVIFARPPSSDELPRDGSID